MYERIGGILAVFIATSLIFQNCSDSVSFDQSQNPSGNESINGQPSSGSPNQPGQPTPGTVINPPTDIVCNPLDPSQQCNSGQGLIGKLYYMSFDIHGEDTTRSARLDDYRTRGIQVPVDLVMTSIDVSPRSWNSGFILPSGDQVKTEGNEKLFEWFSIDVSGFISLPAGRYEFVTVSDDGVRVTLNNQVIIDNNTVHAPEYDCSAQIIEFEPGEKKMIRVQYFQGPRNEIALQLFTRPEAQTRRGCDHAGSLKVVPAAAFSRN